VSSESLHFNPYWHQRLLYNISMELHRETPVFDQGLLIKQCQGTSESRTTPLSFRVIPGTRSITGSSGQSERLFHFEVTDENDPYFLYVLDVGEQDFHLLKRDQALLVEFPVFPTKIVELLQSCLDSQEKLEQLHEASKKDISGDENTDNNINENTTHHSPASHETSSFIAKLDTASGIFSIIEMNEFKQLTHISLQMRQGNDSAIKSYLASRLSLYMSKCSTMQLQLSSTTNELKSELSERNNIAKALEEIKSHKDVAEESLRSAHTNEIAHIQMTFMNQADDARKRYENQLETARNEIDKLRSENKQISLDAEESTLELKRERQHLEFRERELSRLLESAEGDRDRVFNECREISTSKRASDDECSRLERELAREGAKCEAYKLQVKDRDEMVQTAKDLQHSAEDSRKLMEEKLDLYLSDNENLREKIKQGSMEMTRGNAVIQRLQIDKKTLTDKVKTKSDVIRKQEQLVSDLRSKNAEIERLLLTSEENIKMASTQQDNTENKLKEALERLAESTNIISSNKEVIAYLNEEINKWQLGLRTGTEGIAMGTGLGVTDTVEPSKWKSFQSDINSLNNSAQMFSPDTTKDISYGGYHATNITSDKSATAGDFYQQGLNNLGLSDTLIHGETGSGLEHLEYYADVEAKNDYDRVARASSTGNIKYAWQADDFGLDGDSK
jgi:spindle assembly abnormal protein 6